MVPGDEYTPLHYERDVRAHDARKDAFYTRALLETSQQDIADNISEPILKKKRQVSFNFENNNQSSVNNVAKSQKLSKTKTSGQ